MDSTYSQFISNQNKGMIWKLLCDNGTFKSIPDNKANLVKIDFDRKIAVIGESITSTDQLVNLNKRVIGDMVQSIGKYQVPAAAAAANNTLLPTYNAADISQQRQKVFENELKQKQNEFEKFNNKPVPNKIDFADKMDAPIGSEMDKILAEQIALREKQLNIVMETQDKTAANKWLQNGQPEQVLPKDAMTANIQLKIGEDIKLGEKELINNTRKRVNFVEPSKLVEPSKPVEPSKLVEELDFMSLLKKKPVIEEGSKAISDDTIREMLTNILNKQNQILDILTNKYI